MLGYTLVAGAALAVAYPPFRRDREALCPAGVRLRLRLRGGRRLRNVVAALSPADRRVVKADGRRGGHHVVVAEDRLRSTSRLVDHVYRWAAFEGVTVHDGVIVLWTEPGAGALVRAALSPPGGGKRVH